MKFSYKFANLLGTVYHKGNLLFNPDGTTLISPVGNRIALYHLKDNRSETLPVESRFNCSSLALSPDGCILIAVNDSGQALLCSLISKTIIHRYNFYHQITDIKFSPNGKYFAVTKDKDLFLYRAPGAFSEYNPFHLVKVYHFRDSETLCIDWTSDSRVFAVGGSEGTTKIYAVEDFENLIVYALGSHTDSIVGCYFEENSLDMYTVAKNGVLCVWDCSTELDGLIPKVSDKKRQSTVSSDQEDTVDGEENKRSNDAEEEKESSSPDKVYYKRVKRYFIIDEVVKEKEGYVALTASAYHRKTHLLVAGFSNGCFLLYELPDCNSMYSLSISSQVISSVVFNSTGDWIALGCFGVGQLVVWEWQSESFVLKQQGHFNNMKCLAYSPDGMFILTGGEDGKVKLWNTSSGLCVVTRDEHSSSITDVIFAPNGKVFLSASADGTVRAFDMMRYRNFKTFTSPRPTQFSCLAIDPSGDMVCSGSNDSFEIFVWAMQTGQLVKVLAGHEAPVSSISFCPSEAVLVSASWDKTVRIWNVINDKGCRETITLSSDGLCTVFRPDGHQLAVATLDGQISFFNVHTAEQMGSIEGRNDLYVGRRETDTITAKKLLKSQAFTTLCYTISGDCILAAGKSKFICIYHVAECILLKKFEVTCNLSFDAVQDFINRRHLTDWGNKYLIEERGDEAYKAIPLPGTRAVDMTSRTHKPQIVVSSVQFSPTGRAFAAATTEGVLIYSLDNNLVFDPYQLDVSITPQSIRKTLREKNYSEALIMAFRLNEEKVIVEVVETIPVETIPTLVAYLPDLYVDRLLKFVAAQLGTSPHIEFYLIWTEHLLMNHGLKLKSRSIAIKDTIHLLLKNLSQPFEALEKICDHTKYTMEFLSSLRVNDMEEDNNERTLSDVEM